VRKVQLGGEGNEFGRRDFTGKDSCVRKKHLKKDQPVLTGQRHMHRKEERNQTERRSRNESRRRVRRRPLKNKKTHAAKKKKISEARQGAAWIPLTVAPDRRQGGSSFCPVRLKKISGCAEGGKKERRHGK